MLGNELGMFPWLKNEIRTIPQSIGLFLFLVYILHLIVVIVVVVILVILQALILFCFQYILYVFQDKEELMKEVQEARRIKMLHQPSKV